MAPDKQDKATPERITADSVGSLKEPTEEAKKEVKAEAAGTNLCTFPGCGKTFKSQAGLMSHFKSHLGETVEIPEAGPTASVAQMPDVESKPVSETVVSRMSQMQQNMVKELEKQPKMTFYVPLNPGEKEGATIEVGINGVRFVYPKGTFFEAPLACVELIKNYMESVSNAGRNVNGVNYRILDDEKKVDRLM